MMLRVSVAMCTYNGERFLEHQLESLSNQTLRPHELVVCDDRSQDSTFEILTRYRAISAIPVRLVQNTTNLGSTSNFTQAIGLCSGDLIALCDQDDIWEPSKLDRQARLLSDYPDIGGVFCDGKLIDEEGEAMNRSLWDSLGFTRRMRHQVAMGHPLQSLARQNFVTGATLAFRADLRFHFSVIPDGWVHDGWIAWMIAIHSKLVMMPERLISYRIHATNQIGVNLASPVVLLTARDIQTAIDQHKDELLRINSLYDRVPGTSTVREAEAKRLISQRIRFLESRIALLQTSTFARSFTVLRKARSYTKFAKGVRSMIGDMLL